MHIVARVYTNAHYQFVFVSATPISTLSFSYVNTMFG